MRFSLIFLRSTAYSLSSVISLLAIVSCSPGCMRSHRDSASPEMIAYTGTTMGTTYSVKLAGPPKGLSSDQLETRIAERLDWINRRMSTYLPDSEVTRFNRYAEADWFNVSHETATVVAAAQQTAQDTGGVFDITVGPLVELWSFGAERRSERVPSEKEIAAEKSRVGYQDLEVRIDPPSLRKQRADLAIDLSAIAKGYAVDQIAELLDRHAGSGYMVEIGGEVRTKGRRPEGRAWRIGIERPDSEVRTIHCVLALEDRALASSGDYRNFFEAEGQRFSHEIDPRLGAPVLDRLASVSVLAEDTMTADALATALFVMGPDAAWEYAQSHQLDVLLILRDGELLREKMTAGFSKYLAAGKDLRP